MLDDDAGQATLWVGDAWGMHSYNVVVVIYVLNIGLVRLAMGSLGVLLLHLAVFLNVWYSCACLSEFI
jgi:hypothetical protein